MEDRALKDTIASILMLFAFISLISMFVMKSSTYVKSYTIPAKGGIVGPFAVPSDDAIYKLEVGQSLSPNNWSYIYMEVLNEKKEVVGAYGGEMWDEEGYEGSSYWHENERDFTAKMVLHKKGNYYFSFETETANRKKVKNIAFKISKTKGSSVGFTWLFFVSLGLAIFVNEINRRTIINSLSES